MRHPAKNHRGPGLVPGPRPLLTAAALLAAASIMLAVPPRCQAHGVEISAAPGRALIATACYDDGEPMAYVKVLIKGPDGKTRQGGNTDGQGRFAWVADEPGEWTISAADGMGHKAVLAVKAPGQGEEAAKADPAPAQGPASAEVPRWAKAAWGLSALCLVFGVWSWVASRRRHRPR